MSYETVYSTLNPLVATITGLPVAVENEKYTPQVRTVGWARATLLPSEPVEATIGFDRMLRHNGLYQIDIFTPLNIGRYNIDPVVAFFNDKTNRFPDGFEILHSWRGNAVPDDKWHRTICYVRYQYYE